MPGRNDLLPIAEAQARYRAAADTGIFVNARCDVFRGADAAKDGERLVAAVIERARAYADAGAHDQTARLYRQVVDHRGTDPFSPVVTAAQLGLAESLLAAGDRQGSRQAFDVLIDWWQDADSMPTSRMAAGIAAELGRRLAEDGATR